MVQSLGVSKQGQGIQGSEQRHGSGCNDEGFRSEMADVPWTFLARRFALKIAFRCFFCYGLGMGWFGLVWFGLLVCFFVCFLSCYFFVNKSFVEHLPPDTSWISPRS